MVGSAHVGITNIGLPYATIRESDWLFF
jgi:hypothetical protein